MSRLLCRLGLHRPAWVPVLGHALHVPVRRCRDCGQPLGKQHR